MMVFGAYMLVNIWQNNQSCASGRLDPATDLCYNVRDPLDLAVVAAALTGACFGFLWWNASPAAIFMGDTGSLALGGAVAGLAILTRTELLLVILGGLFVLETVSVVLQVDLLQGHQAADRHRAGRIFRIAPIHHHFEMLGWEQVTVDDPVLDHHRPLRRRRSRRLLRRVGRGHRMNPARTWAGTTPGRASARSSPGFGVSGFAAADNLIHLGADVTALDECPRPARRRRPSCSRCSAPRSGSGEGAPPPCPTTSTWSSPRRAGGRRAAAGPGPRRAASRSGARSSWPGGCATPTTTRPWLAVTGTNGKTTTVQMLDAILRADGLRSVAAGNVGLPLVEAVMDPEPYDVLAVELSQLPAALHRLDERPGRGGAQRRRGPPRLVRRRWRTYAADKGRIYERVQRACVYNVADPVTEQLVREADVVEGARAIGFTLGMPGVGMVGVVEDILADRAFVEQRETSAAELCTLADLAAPRDRPPGAAHRPERAGRRRPGPGARRQPGRRPRRAARRSGPTATGSPWSPSTTASPGSTTPRPPTRTPPGPRCSAYDPVVWVAGGLAKGASFDDLVRAVAGRLRGVVLLGRDRDLIAAALARHAPDVPVIDVGSGETAVTEGDEASVEAGPMRRVVAAAAELARPGRHGAPGPGLRLDGHVHRLRRPRGRLRRGGAGADRLAGTGRTGSGDDHCEPRAHPAAASSSRPPPALRLRPRLAHALATGATRSGRAPGSARCARRSTGRSRPTTCCSAPPRCCSPSA